MTEALVSRFRATFSRDPELIARAPGRIEVIGNHTDYNGGPVLGAAIDRSTWVAFAARSDGSRRFASEVKPGVVEAGAGAPERRAGSDSWANYPLGVLSAMAASGLPTPGGFDYEAVSDVPSGAGLSSSAAIELASALVFTAATGCSLGPDGLAALGRRAENDFVGVPCGILDQGVSAFGKRDHLVYIDCRGPKFSTVPLPAGAHFWIFNTHTKHALVDGLYATRHQECMEAAKIMGVGLLADANPAMLAAAETRLPRPAFKRARHVIDEIARVGQAVEALKAGDLPMLGRLLLESHRSSTTWFENSCRELDFLVDTLEGEKGVFGARLTGGGFGGAVVALASGVFGDQGVRRVSEAYLARFGSRPDVLHAFAG
ncbi:MAG TPA: galactokinase, partial [Opitutaceae bacterium]